MNYTKLLAFLFVWTLRVLMYLLFGLGVVGFCIVLSIFIEVAIEDWPIPLYALLAILGGGGTLLIGCAGLCSLYDKAERILDEKP